MHELSLMQGVLDSVIPVAVDAGATSIDSITLTVGEMTEVVEDAMRFAFDALTEGEALLSNTELVLDFIKPRSKCLDCGNEFEHDRFHLSCPACSSRATMIVAGKELHISSIEVDIPD